MHFIVCPRYCCCLCCCVYVILCLDCSASMHMYDDANRCWKRTERHKTLSLYCWWFERCWSLSIIPFRCFCSMNPSLSRYLMWSFDHNSIHIINLFSGRTICFFALPIYFQMHFFWFDSVRCKQNPISYHAIASLQFVSNHQCTLVLAKRMEHIFDCTSSERERDSSFQVNL